MDIPQDFMAKFVIDKRTKHEFQLVGKEITDYCNQSAYHLFSIYNHQKIKDAFEIIKKRNVHSLKYLVGVIKKL